MYEVLFRLALYCKYLNISIDILSLPHKHRCSTQWGDQRLAVHRAPLEIWSILTAQFLLFKLSENSLMLSIIIFLFFEAECLFYEYEPLCVTTMAVIMLFGTIYFIISKIKIQTFINTFIYLNFIFWKRRNVCVFEKLIKCSMFIHSNEMSLFADAH